VPRADTSSVGATIVTDRSPPVRVTMREGRVRVETVAGRTKPAHHIFFYMLKPILGAIWLDYLVATAARRLTNKWAISACRGSQMLSVR